MDLSLRCASPIALTVLLFSAAAPQTGAPSPPPGAPPATRPAPDPADPEVVQRELGDWMMNYYRKPEPERIPWFLDQMHQHGFLKLDPVLPPVTAFLSEVFAANPDRLNEWFPADGPVFADERFVVYRALWACDKREAIAILDAAHSAAPEAIQTKLVAMRQSPPRPLVELTITAPAQLDMLWGAFFAGGKEDYLDRLIGVLERDPEGPGIEQITLCGAARWSIASNARSHERVYRACRRQIGVSQNPFLQEALKEIVESNAERWPDPAPASAPASSPARR